MLRCNIQKMAIIQRYLGMAGAGVSSSRRRCANARQTPVF